VRASAIDDPIESIGATLPPGPDKEVAIGGRVAMRAFPDIEIAVADLFRA